MFQNDYVDQPASSQQTNSASSLQLVSSSQFRAYATLVAAFILYEWFQIVATAHTAISILLLAIIGLFLGKLTDRPELEEAHQGIGSLERKRQEEEESLTGRRGSQTKPYSPTASPNSNSSSSSNSGQSANSNQNTLQLTTDSTHTLNPLIKADLKLLKTLSSSSSKTSDEHEEQSVSLRQVEHSGKGSRNEEKPLVSPSNSCNSNSTGYNSDNTNPPLRTATPTPSLPELIELVPSPTALELLMDEFSPRKELQQSTRLDELESHYSSPQTQTKTKTKTSRRSPLPAGRDRKENIPSDSLSKLDGQTEGGSEERH